MVTWLTEEIESRGWSLRELGRRSDLSHSTISNILSGVQNPGLEFCLGIAKAFRIPAEMVMHRAGLLPPYPDKEDVGRCAFIDEVTDILRNLNLDDRELVYDFARMRYERAQEQRAQYGDAIEHGEDYAAP